MLDPHTRYACTCVAAYVRAKRLRNDDNSDGYWMIFRNVRCVRYCCRLVARAGVLLQNPFMNKLSEKYFALRATIAFKFVKV